MTLYSNLGIFFIIVFLVLIGSIALNAALYCFLPGIVRRSHPPVVDAGDLVKLPPKIAALPTLVFSDGMRMAGAEAMYSICLSEFEVGEEVNILPRCNHDFHMKCVEGWWFASCSSSCLTCCTRCGSSLLEKIHSLPENPPKPEI